MTSPMHAPLPVSLCCASWRTKPQHEDCPGKVRAGNLGTPVPCGCDCHQPRIVESLASQRLAEIREARR